MPEVRKSKMILSEVTPLPCSFVNNLTTNTWEQCKFVVDNDCLESDSVFDYVYIVYCSLGSELRSASIVMVVFLVILFFLALSAVADEFLCPSLLAVSKNLRMSDSLAGVTLLAFGNGCPDIFASLAAANDDRPELIVGELLGAGIFCTSIVSGLIFISHDFKLACRPILRDTTFYLFSVYLIWSYCWSQEITFYKSLAFIIIYLVYLTVALGGQAVHSRLQGNYAIAEIHVRNDLGKEKDGDKTGDWLKRNDESQRKKQLAKKLESCTVDPGVRVQYNDGVTSIHLGSDSSSCSSTTPLERQLYASINKSLSNCDHSMTNKAFVDDNGKIEKINSKEQPNHLATSQQQQVLKLQHHQPQHLVIRNCDDLNSNEWDELLAQINPIDVTNWQEVSLNVKIIRILRAPIIFAAIITVPVVDNQKKYNNWCRALNSIHCITVPMFVIISTRLGGNENLFLFGLPPPVLVLIVGSFLAIIVLKVTDTHEIPSFHAVFAYVGFLMSIMWVYLLATEMISLLKTVGIMFSMSDTAIGLGILAWGNSLGDIVANTSLAEAGYPRMAIGACIGAPLLNLLLGFGLSFTVSLKLGEFSPVEYSPTITLLCSTLAIILMLLMLSTLAPPNKSKKIFGFLLISIYGVYFSLAVCLEYGLIKF